MRSWSCALSLVAVVAVIAEGQRVASGSSQSNTDTDNLTRLGLVATDLGLQAVPGGHSPTGNPVSSPIQRTECHCLPINQACSNQQNAPPIGVCPDAGQQMCCGNPGRPNPVVPSPTQIGSCGAQNSNPYRNANDGEADFAEYPWMVNVLDHGDRSHGGGVLISSDWVLTAAHKVVDANSYKVRLGEYDVSQSQDHPQFPHQEVNVDNVILHPNYNPDLLTNNVALLHLSQSVNTQSYPHIRTACLPEKGQHFIGMTCWVTGWGKQFDHGSFQQILKEVDVPIIDPNSCEERLRQTKLGDSYRLDTHSFLCAGGNGKDACTGDGGAPLVCSTDKGWTVAGLVAWGIGCANNNPGVYVNVANFRDFIHQHIGF